MIGVYFGNYLFTLFAPAEAPLNQASLNAEFAGIGPTPNCPNMTS